MTASKSEPERTPRVAQRLDALGSEGSFRVAAEARALEQRGHDIIHLEFGEPDFPSPPHVVEAAIAALRGGFTKYAPPPGIPALREAIAASARARDISAAAEEIVVTSGAKPMLLYSMLALIQDGDEVLVPDPGFPIYPSVARLAGGVPRGYPLVASGDGYAIDIEALAAAITPRTRALFLNTPHNPTGWVASASELLDLANLVLEHDLWVVTDEIYHGLTYASSVAPSIATLPGLKRRTVVIDGFSKRYAMTGWRLGFGILPSDVARKVTLLVINDTSCAPHFVQLAALAALQGPQDCIAQFREAFRRRRDAFVRALGTTPGVAAPLPAGAFYAFTDVRDVLERSRTSTEAFAKRLLEEFGVAALPGTDFGPGGAGSLRFSFAASQELLDQAVARLTKCVEAASAASPPQRTPASARGQVA